MTCLFVFLLFCFLKVRRPPVSTLTDTLFPSTALCRSMVFQSFNLFPHLTVLDNVTLGPRKVRRWPKARSDEVAREMLERVKIPEQAGKYPGQLSGGQRSEEHTSELQSLMRISYAVFCLKKKKKHTTRI